MAMRGNLDALREVPLENLEKFSELFNYQKDIEAMSYHTITEGRLGVINKLQKDVDKQEIERVIQKHIYKYLWLLDPSWDRASTDKHIEEQVIKRWKKLDGQKGKEEIQKLRLDIRYRKTSGQHVVIELKNPGKSFKHHQELSMQIQDYMDAVSDILRNPKNKEDDNVEGVIIVGHFPKDWNERRKRGLKESRITITTYQEVISQAKNQYQDYLKAQEEASEKIRMINKILSSIDKDE